MPALRTARRRKQFIGGLLATVTAVALSVSCAQAATPLTATAPCVGAAAPRAYSHVVVIFMENRSFGQIVGSPSAPYINRLAGRCGLASQYYGIRYPSLPNYLAASAGSTFGVADDLAPSVHPIAGSSIFSQTGSGWNVLAESMPTNCDTQNAYPYMVKHNPAAYFTGTRTACLRQNTPLPANPTFAARFTLVVPNMIHDMHDGTIAQGDAWLAGFVPKVLNSAAYQSRSTIVVIVWDTDDRGSANRAPALVIAPQVIPGTVSATRFNHYSLLRLSEDTLGLARLRAAATASSMRSAFHL